MSLPLAISDCLCDTGKCKERGKVCWEADRGQYLHIRVDDNDECVQYLDLVNLKRADCVILHLAHDGKIYACVVEVKTRRYDLDEVKEKMENTLNALDKILNFSLIPIPILYAESHEKWAKRYAFLKKVKYKGLVPITFLKYCESIQKAIESAQKAMRRR